MRISDWSSDVCSSDLTIRSWPARALGMAAAWTEVGSVKPAFRTADNRVGARPKVSKDMSILCRSNGIHIELGRGSEPGALVAWSIVPTESTYSAAGCLVDAARGTSEDGRGGKEGVSTWKV